MATYLFNITLKGTGETPEDAWADAVEAFGCDPGVVEEGSITKEED